MTVTAMALELGGKDVMIVDDDANVDAAAAVYDRFVAKAVELAAGCAPAPSPTPPSAR
jgi:hypothetical protein